jgi:multidrug efflux pump subunit AcrA (membrane-fusion protein)
MTNPIFRQSALEGLSSPEQLDRLVKITPPRAWIALWAVVAILGAVLVWSFVGALPTRIAGRGVLIHDGGTFNVVATSGGTLLDFAAFTPGEPVHKGQVIARITDPALQQQLAAAEAEVLASRGETSPEGAARRAEAAAALDRLRAQVQLGGEVVSERDGVVVEAMAANGDAIQVGDPIISVEYAHTPLRAVFYLPPQSNAKLLRPGMTAEISPVTSRRERDGYLIGKIRAVSKYPATEAGMLALLPNPGLVRQLAQDGAPIAVDVDLIPAPRSPGGYLWSSGDGEGLEISSGTLCSGAFVVETRRPIALVFPSLDRRARKG